MERMAIADKISSPSYSDMKIRKAIKCYYSNKAFSLGLFFHNGELAKRVCDGYIYRCIVPDDIVSLNFLSILFTDLDVSLYDLDIKGKRDRLIALHKEHFNAEIEELPMYRDRITSIKHRTDDIE